MQFPSYTSVVFAPVDRDLSLERVAGGNETEVYRTDDRRRVVKLKGETGSTLAEALAHARTLRDAADRFAVCLGPRYSIPSAYLLSRDEAGRVQVLVIQPFISNARPLAEVDYKSLTPHQREQIAVQLYDIVRRARQFYRETGCMPDLYGRTSRSAAERRQMRRLHMLPKRLWSFLVQRTLLRSHNLLLTNDPQPHIVLVDYDPVRRGRLYRRVYYAVRWLLFLRDDIIIARMRRGRSVPARRR